ncbi:MAG TPA: tyrosine-type recombinase/integrase [Chthonomonadaceae bacterium]|nr:tyrosine-type recombinase/integrase [Chthonomonadaceae bacterium]
MLLQNKRSENTRRAYRHDVHAFFEAVYGRSADSTLVRHFLSQTATQMAAQLLQYKARLIREQRSEATINRRLAALLSLVRFARRVGLTEADPGKHVEGEKVVAYRDTRGITAEMARKLLRQPDRATLKGKRDYALLLLLLENALRRAEVVHLRARDFDPVSKTVCITGKGRGTQKEPVTLSAEAVQAIRLYLEACPHERHAEAPLFINVSPAAFGRGLTADGLYKIVRGLARQAGLPAVLSPHRLRHTAITLALDASGGDIRRVKRLSRHARLETLQIYDDNRSDLQGEMTELLSRILRASD